MRTINYRGYRIEVYQSPIAREWVYEITTPNGSLMYGGSQTERGAIDLAKSDIDSDIANAKK